jgi:EAL domain-containing protein (putative c-di-GMP-specific phosphodiesterase class I)
VHTSTSIGIGIYPQDARDAAQLMRNADTAMYHAKQNRRGSIEFFHEELNTRELERTRWVAELQEALVSDQLELLYQPRASLPERSLSGIEALLYWRHPRHGLMAASQFLPAVNDRQLLDQVSAWSIGAACTQVGEWRALAPALPQLTISIDLPVLRITPEIATMVLSHVRKCKLSHGWLELDICEHLLIGTGDVEPVLRQLKAAGVRLAVDDFGSAGASLATLKNLSLDILKIDPIFVRALGDEGGTDMVAAIIHLGRALGMRVLAKGVERDDQLTILNSLGCDLYQGDLFSVPLQAGAMLALQQDKYTDALTSQARPKPAKNSTSKTRGTRR